MGLNDDDEDLVALRLAALSTMKAKKATENAMKLKSSTCIGGVSIRDGFGNQNNALFQPHYNSNLIAIVPISPSTETEQPRTRRVVGFRHHQPQPQLNKLILPQHRYCKTEEAVPRTKEKPAVKTKFNRYDSSSDSSSEESEDEGSGDRPPVAGQDGGAARQVAVAPLGGDEEDSDAEPPSFLVELEEDVESETRDIRGASPDDGVPSEKGPQDHGDGRVSPDKAVVSPPPPREVETTPAAARPPPSPHRSPRYRSPRSRSPFYAERSRSRSRLGRSKSPPRRYGARRSPSPKRRAVSPRYLSPRRRSPPSPPHSPARRRPSSPRRPPARYASPPSWRRPSLSPPPRRRYSPQAGGGVRRRKSPSPVKRNPSPPRRFSPQQRRSPLGRRVSPPRRNPSPPRKLYIPAGGQTRPHSPPRRYASPSPRRYNGSQQTRGQLGDSSPWSPPRNRSPQFAGRRRSVSPRGQRSRITPPYVKIERKSISPRGQRGRITPPFIKTERKSVSPRPLPKRWDSVSPRGSRGRLTPPFIKTERKSMSPPRGQRGRITPPLVVKTERKSVSPPRGDHKRRGAAAYPPSPRRRSASPRGAALSPAPKRRRSISPRAPRAGTKRTSDSPSGFDLRRLGGSPGKTRRLDERDARATIRGPRDNSKSLSLSPPPDRVKVKSPLRVRAHRHERAANGKRRPKSSKKSRDKTSTVVKADKSGDKCSVLEARRRKFESVDPIRPVNKKIRLKTAVAEEGATKPAERDESATETTHEVHEESEEDADALVLHSPADLWSDEESDSGNEGRFKLAGRPDADGATQQRKAGVRPEPSRAVRAERDPKRDKSRERVKRRRRTRPEAADAEAGGGDVGAAGADKLPALLSKEVLKPDPVSRSTPDPTDRISRLEPTDQRGDLRAALSRKRAARSGVLFPFKGGDKGKLPGSRLVQSAFLDAVGKKQKRSKKTLTTQPSLLKLTDNLAGAAKDARRVTLYNQVKASVKQLSESVTLATDESTLKSETYFSADEEKTRKPPVKLRLGLPGGRKVKLKRHNNAASDQV